MGCDHHNNQVINSRPHKFGSRRRRECTDCGHRWSTIEIPFNFKKQDVISRKVREFRLKNLIDNLQTRLDQIEER